MTAGVLAAVVTLLVSTMIWAASPAHARVGDIELGRARVENLSGSDVVTQYNFLRFEWDWAAPDGVYEGAEFWLTFPDVFRVADNPGFNLVDSQGVVGGTCSIEGASKRMVCRFNDAFVGKDQVRGTVAVEAQAVYANSSRRLQFYSSNGMLDVTLPGRDGEPGIASANVSPPQSFRKEGWFEDNQREIRWTISFPGDVVQGMSDLMIDDQLVTISGSPHKFISRAGEYAVQYNSREQLLDPRGTGKEIDFELQPNSDGTRQVIVLHAPEGGWDPKENYQVSYMSTTADGEVAPVGTTVRNDARLRGTNSDAFAVVLREQNGSGTIGGVDRGTFEISKVLKVAQDRPRALIDGIPFKVEVAVDAPAAYDHLDRTYTIDVPLNGQPVRGAEELPAGTVVTLREIQQLNGFVFGAPEFRATDSQDSGRVALSDNNATAKITIDPARVVGVTLINDMRAEAKFTMSKQVNQYDKHPNDPDFKQRQYQVAYRCTSPFDYRIVVAEGEVLLPGTGEKIEVATVPSGSTCSAQEINSPKDKNYEWSVHNEVPEKKIGEGRSNIHITNTYRHLSGRFSVSKRMEGLVDPDKEFLFPYTCDDGKPHEPLRVRGDGTVVTSPPILSGTVCEIREDEQSAQVEGYNLSTTATATRFTVEANTTTPIEFTNTYRTTASRFDIVKRVRAAAGVSVPANKQFRFSYTCQKDGAVLPEHNNRELVMDNAGAGGRIQSPEIPEGAVCQVSEDGAAARISGTKLEVSEIQPVTIVAGRANVVEVENNYTPQRGTFRLRKVIERKYNVQIPEDKEFLFRYTCTLDGEVLAGHENRELLITGEGELVSDPLPTGAECTIAEDDSRAQEQPASLEITNPDPVIIPEGEVEAVVKNTYEPPKGYFMIDKITDFGPGVQLKPQYDDFEFNYTCFLGGQVMPEYENKTMEILTGGEFFSGYIPVGATCRVTENEEKADIALNATVSHPAALNIPIVNFYTGTVYRWENSYSIRGGKFAISKTVETDGNVDMATRKRFEFSYTCTKDGAELDEFSDLRLVVNANQRVESVPIPVGAQCVITERARFAEIEGKNHEPVAPITVDITDESTVEVPVVNKYTTTATNFKVRKVVHRPEHVYFPYYVSFRAIYSCSLNGTPLPEFQNQVLELQENREVASPNIPVGAQCEISEDPTSGQVENAVYTSEVSHPQLTLEAGVEPTVVTITNTYTHDGGFIDFRKIVRNDDGVDLWGTSFFATYSCTKDGQPVDGATDESIGLDENREVRSRLIPFGSRCTISEPVESTSLYIHKVDIDRPEVEIVKGLDVPLVTITNTYEAKKNTFFVEKDISAPAGVTVPADKKFMFTYSCFRRYTELANYQDLPLEVSVGQASESIPVPAGARCIIREDEDSAQLDGAVLRSTYPQEVTIQRTTQPTVSFTNHYREADPVEGSFTLRKDVLSLGWNAIPPGIDTGFDPGDETIGAVYIPGDKEFIFHYTCTKDGAVVDGADNTEVRLRADADFESPVFPIGTECTVTEDIDAAQVDGTTLYGPSASTFTISARHRQVLMRNQYHALPEGTITVAKEVAGARAEQLREHPFTVNYRCVDTNLYRRAQELTGSLTVTAATPAILRKVPFEMECEFEEVRDDAPAANLSFNPAASTTTARVQVDHNNFAQQVQLVNHYDERTTLVPVRILGEVTGSGATGDPADLSVTASWGDRTETFTVQPGEAYTGLPDLPEGTELSIIQDVPAATETQRWDTPRYRASVDGTIREAAEGRAVVATVTAGAEPYTIILINHVRGPAVTAPDAQEGEVPPTSSVPNTAPSEPAKPEGEVPPTSSVPNTAPSEPAKPEGEVPPTSSVPNTAPSEPAKPVGEVPPTSSVPGTAPSEPAKPVGEVPPTSSTTTSSTVTSTTTPATSTPTSKVPPRIPAEPTAEPTRERTTTPAVAVPTVTTTTASTSTTPRGLAQTGASVLGLACFATLAVLGGAFLLLRRGRGGGKHRA